MNDRALRVGIWPPRVQHFLDAAPAGLIAAAFFFGGFGLRPRRRGLGVLAHTPAGSLFGNSILRKFPVRPHRKFLSGEAPRRVASSRMQGLVGDLQGSPWPRSKPFPIVKATSLIDQFCPCFALDNSLLCRVGNFSGKPAESLASVVHGRGKSRLKCPNSLYYPCLTGKSNQRRVRSRLAPPPPYVSDIPSYFSL
jgi:hypothetical protein